MTFESLVKNPRNQHNHIKANGRVFHSDVKALSYITSLTRSSTSVNKPTMDDDEQRLSDYLARKGLLEFCMRGVDPGDDWKTEPEQTFEQLCDSVCRTLEQRYDNIYISYSGGTDSDTIADAFLRCGVRNVTLVNVANIPVQKRIDARRWLAKHTGEAVRVKYAGAIDNLGWRVMMFQGWQPTNDKQFEKSMLEREFMSWARDYANVNAWAQNSGEITLTKNSKRSCWVVGLEKPHLTVHKGWYCFQMHHNLFDTPLSCVDPNSDLIHFWLNDMVPGLIKKMAHAKCREIVKIFKEQGIRANKQTVEAMNRHTSKYYQRISRAMGLGGLTKFLMTAETHSGGVFRSMDLAQQCVVMADNKQILDKIASRDRYFDQVIAKETHSAFLNLEAKKLMNIYSKPIPILAVEE